MVVTQVRWGEVSTPTISMDERGSLRRALPARTAGGRGNDTEGAAKRSETVTFLDGLRTHLEKKQEHETYRKGLEGRGAPLGQKTLSL